MNVKTLFTLLGNEAIEVSWLSIYGASIDSELNNRDVAHGIKLSTKNGIF